MSSIKTKNIKRYFIATICFCQLVTYIVLTRILLGKHIWNIRSMSVNYSLTNISQVQLPWPIRRSFSASSIS